MMSFIQSVGADWFAVIVAVLALSVSAYNFRQMMTTRESILLQSFISQRNAINIAFAEFKVKGPFAHHLQIRKDDLEEFIPKICLLFLQINLMNDVFSNRKNLSSRNRRAYLEAYDSWAKNIVGPWIKGDPQLVEALKLIYATDDILPADFVDWLKKRISLS